jgi:hypothetical protein
MKYYETSCAEYIAASKRVDMHPELKMCMSNMPDTLNHFGNIVFYGPSGVGKYTQFLRFVERYSLNGLKTEKMTAMTEKQKYEYHISDIHYEIDLALLGCESKKIWNECFFQIVDIVSAKKSKCGIILCKNFQAIHSELLDVFYSYMQHCRALNIHIVFAILTEHVSFIPNRILQCCKLIPVKRPDIELYKSACYKGPIIGQYPKSHKTFLQRIHPSSSRSFMPIHIANNNADKKKKSPSLTELNMTELNMTESESDVSDDLQNAASWKQEQLGGEVLHHQSFNSDVIPEFLLNMKEMHFLSKVSAPPKDVFNIICDNIILKMTQHESLDIISLRDNLYDILLYGLDVTECLWYILYYFVETDIFVDKSGKTLSEIMNKINSFLKYYNNNYRPIYHLESIFIYLITKIYQYPE